MKRTRLIILGTVLVSVLITGFYLVQPRVTYNGRIIDLNELNAIRSNSNDAQYCVQHVSAFSRLIGQSFDFHCFDTEAEATVDSLAVQAEIKALEAR